jgi:hypothetical protein
VPLIPVADGGEFGRHELVCWGSEVVWGALSGVVEVVGVPVASAANAWAASRSKVPGCNIHQFLHAGISWSEPRTTEVAEGIAKAQAGSPAGSGM